jgi:predicted N-formylglutamate amidohydrolase
MFRENTDEDFRGRTTVSRLQHRSLERRPLYQTVKGQSCLLLLSVHEGDYIPASLSDEGGRPLGIANPADLERHIAIDHGIREVTRLVAASTKANVFRATHSRLVADINRFPDERRRQPTAQTSL